MGDDADDLDDLDDLARRAHTVAADPRTTSVIAGGRVDLLEALETLEAQQPDLVEALVLRDVGELDHAEIARQVDVPVGTATSRVHRARQAIRPLLVTGP
ncbi:MAG: sigma factor-like helix-turn-helix DNA-binding protein [Nocardioidaceae bacterium]|nr:sigma factor-like helix-turn-helix DNA-binding protein [Nocardioidaceae bacterium]